MGDAIPDLAATLEATAFGLLPGEPTHRLKLYRDGEVADAVSIDPPGDTYAFRAETPGRYRIQLEIPRPPKADLIVALSSSVTVPEPAAALSGIAAAVALLAMRTRASLHPRG
jgi:hypothetical protein